MDLHPTDDGVTRSLDLIAQTARGNFDRFLLLGLSLAQKTPHDEDKHRPQDNQCTQNFRDHFSQLPLSPEIAEKFSSPSKIGLSHESTTTYDSPVSFPT